MCIIVIKNLASHKEEYFLWIFVTYISYFFETQWIEEEFPTQKFPQAIYCCPKGTNIPFTGEYLAIQQNFTGILWTLLQSTVVFLLRLKQVNTVHLKCSIVGIHGYVQMKADCCSVQSRPALLSMCPLSPVWMEMWLDSCKMRQTPS